MSGPNVSYSFKISEATDGVSAKPMYFSSRGMSRSLLNIAKRSLPRLTLRGVGLASKDVS